MNADLSYFKVSKHPVPVAKASLKRNESLRWMSRNYAES